MRAVVESHELVIEAGQLLLTTRAHTVDEDLDRLKRLRGAVEASEEGAVLEKVYNLHTLRAVVSKAAMLFHARNSSHCGLRALSPCGFGRLGEGETAEQRARGLSWLHLVTSVPLIMWQSRGIHRHGLTMWDLELVLRLHLSQALLIFKHKELPLAGRFKYKTSFIDNVTCIYKREPTHPVNVNSFIEFCSSDLACQLLRIVIAKADKRGDYQVGSMMRWHLCAVILTGGEGQVVPVAKILKLVKEAHTAMEQAARWGADSPMTPTKAPYTYWPCLGFAMRCKAAIKADPSFAQSTVRTFGSREKLALEMRHITGVPTL
ncbi:hypothetical protein COCOBI_15-4320 [Coccomyxa sp. Obi]|nr:hypothetical protein COCOBI_15-4320 [Coccomyxa sp. Obi]